MKTKFLTFALLVAGFSSCTRSISIQELRPPVITVSGQDISLLVADRSRARSGFLNALGGWIIGEGMFNDGHGRVVLIDSLVPLLESMNIKTSRYPEIMKARRWSTKLPKPLSSAKVKDLASSNNVNFLLCLEYFDSDYLINENDEGVELNKEITVYGGFRLYDGKTGQVLHEKDYEGKKFWSPEERIGSIFNTSRRDGVEEIAVDFARSYAGYFLPHWEPVKRSYYTGSALSVGNRFARQGRWDKAAEEWKKIWNDRKINSRLAFNLALAYEMQNDIGTALYYARKAEDTGNKRALSYVRILLERQRAIQQLEKSNP